MARQSRTPVQFNMTTRPDAANGMTSMKAGLVYPLTFFPLLRGDSAGGSFSFDLEMSEQPRPVQNAVFVNVQAWFVPKAAHPQFPGLDEFNHSYAGQPIKQLGAADRTPPPFYHVLSGASVTTAAASTFFETLGLHIPAGEEINADLIDAFNVIYNFRLTAHSSRLPLKKYAIEDLAAALALPPAFWPTGRHSEIVPDYERALIVGSFDFDVAAGQLPLTGLYGQGATSSMTNGKASDGTTANRTNIFFGNAVGIQADAANGFPAVMAEMAGQNINVTLADIDKARLTQSFAKLRASYAGTNTTGFKNDDAIISLLMQGFTAQESELQRPWLLGQTRVPVNMMERPATDGASLDQSVTIGMASGMIALNVPRNDVGGLVIVTAEILPERLFERQSDEWLLCTTVDDLPNALRDVQRTEPVDMVPNRRIDAKHTAPNGAYGWEGMNHKWKRDFTRLGGKYYQATPGAPWTEARAAIWQTDIVDAEFTADHYLAPVPFPQDVFADETSDIAEIVWRHQVAITGITQMGDVLMENNDDYEAVAEVAGE